MARVDAETGRFLEGYKPFRAWCEGPCVAGKPFTIRFDGAAGYKAFTAEFLDDAGGIYRVLPRGRDQVAMDVIMPEAGPVTMLLIGRGSKFVTAGLGALKLMIQPAGLKGPALTSLPALGDDDPGSDADFERKMIEIDIKFDNLFKTPVTGNAPVSGWFMGPADARVGESVNLTVQANADSVRRVLLSATNADLSTTSADVYGGSASLTARMNAAGTATIFARLVDDSGMVVHEVTHSIQVHGQDQRPAGDANSLLSDMVQARTQDILNRMKR